MIFFQEELRKMLQEELNKNTKNVLFDVSLFFTKHNAYFTKLMAENNKLRAKEIPFSLLHIERIDVDRVNLPEHEMLDAVVQATIQIPTDKGDMFDNKPFNSVFSALDEFIRKFNAKTLPFGKTEYDLISGAFEVDYNLGEVRNIGMTLKFKEEATQTIYRSGLNRPNDLIRINQIGKQLQFQFRNTGDTGYNTILVDIELDKDIEIVISRISITINLYVNGVLYTTTSTTLQSSTKDDFTPYNGTIQEFYTQITPLDLDDYLNDITTMESVFDNPTVKVLDFITLENLADTNNTLTKIGRISTIGSYGYATFSFDTVTPLGGIFEMFGTDYQEYDFTFNVLLSKDTFMGNQVEYYLDDVRIYPFNKNTGVGSENLQEQMINDDTTKGVNSSSGLSNEFSLYVKREKKIIDLIKFLKTDFKRNTVFNLKILYPTEILEYNVNISDFGISPLEGEPLNYSITLNIATEELTEE